MTGSRDDDQEGRKLWNRLRGDGMNASGSDCPDLDALSAYLDGNASEAEAEEVEAHLASCASCLEALEDVRAIQDEAPNRVPEALLKAAERQLAGD